MATAALRPTSASVDPGGEASFQIEIRNDGDVVDEFSLEVRGHPAAWAEIEPPVLRLLPGDKEKAKIRFRPPRAASTRAGATPFAIKVVAKEDPEGTVVEEGTLQVGSFSETALDLRPRTAHGRFRARHLLYLDNRGNAPVTGAVSATDPNEKVSFEIDPPTLAAEPGTAAVSKIRARPQDRFLRGEPRTHQYDVVVEPEGDTPIATQGTMLQEPIIPRWAPMALAGLVALAALWFFALRPTIKAIARDQAEEATAEQDRKIADLAGQVNGLAGVVAQGGGPGAVSASPGAPITPVDGRLQWGGQTAYAVPAESSLHVSDLILQNPQGDFGVLTVLRGSQPVLVTRLENFRDFDYHFVTPLVFAAGQPLSIQVECENAGQSPPKPGECTPGVYFAGFLTKLSS